MKFPLYWVDAFSDRVFRGNPAGVVPLEAWPEDAVMQHIAFENGLAETAFFVRTGANHFRLRWFTPTLEVDLCGHATLAAAFTLFTQLNQAGDHVVFESRSGPLSVTRRSGTTLELDFPSRPAVPLETPSISPGLLRGMGPSAPRAWLKVPSHLYYLAVFDTELEVRAVRPDLPALASLGDVRVIVTAPGGDCDFVSRFFAPGAGVPEDPVTGSAHCTLVPYWSAKLGRTALHARQVSPRGGELWCDLAGDRVKIAGSAVLYLRGEIVI
jgi:predicted PhzF superfamily epimerase YddE/YHI9